MIIALKIIGIVTAIGLATAAVSVAGLLVMDLVRSINRWRDGYYN
jgi:hypothetical protein